MRKISLWAKNHKGPARITIAVSLLMLGALAIITGILLQEIAVLVSPGMLLAFTGVYFAAAIAYPVRTEQKKIPVSPGFYRQQKTCDWLLAASTFCMIVFFSNQPERLFTYAIPLHAAIPATTTFPKDSVIKTYKSIAAFTASLKDKTGKSLKWKEKKKLLKEQIRAIKKNNDMSQGGKVALIILSVLVAIGLLYLVAALACGLSCNGSAGAAVLVTIGGTGLVIFLLIIVIRAILGKKKKPKETEIKPAEPAKIAS